jgi:hypothetical protein
VLDLTCSVAPCPRAPKGRGWCHAHYERWRLTGDVQADKPVARSGANQEVSCTVVECVRGAITGGLCPAHADKRRLYGDPLGSAPRPDLICNVGECNNRTYGRGYCKKHYNALRSAGDVEIWRGTPPECSEEDCSGIAVVRGYCNAHYQRHVQLGDLDWTRQGTSIACAARGCPDAALGDGKPYCPRHNRNLRNRGSVPVSICIGCDQLIPEDAGFSRVYCNSCAKTRQRLASRDCNHRRRAVEYGADSERFSSLEIFERDRWICGLCKKRVDRRLAHPNTMSASLDHKLPIAVGGSHTRANVQLAHLTCNLQKRHRGAPEQLALVG